jgi:hypothetical protein
VDREWKLTVLPLENRVLRRRDEHGMTADQVQFLDAPTRVDHCVELNRSFDSRLPRQRRIHGINPPHQGHVRQHLVLFVPPDQSIRELP